jgi:hypothetical protein
MKSIYEVIPANEITPQQIKRTDEDGSVWWIPTDPANSDYQAYLKSLDEANTL